MVQQSFIKLDQYKMVQQSSYFQSKAQLNEINVEG